MQKAVNNPRGADQRTVRNWALVICLGYAVIFALIMLNFRVAAMSDADHAKLAGQSRPAATETMRPLQQESWTHHTSNRRAVLVRC